MIACRQCLALYDGLFRAEADRRARAGLRFKISTPACRANVAELRALRRHIEAVQGRLDEHLGRHAA